MHIVNIEDKPKGCFAWTPKNSKKVMCNSIPCCGFCVSPQAQKNVEKEGSFKTQNGLRINTNSNHISN